MRAREFILEASSMAKTKGRIHRDHVSTMPNAHRVAGTADRCYDLNRVMMAVAMADGIQKPVLPGQSWHHRNNTAHPYTAKEATMLKHAYEAAGVEWDDVLRPNADNRSEEPSDNNTTSVIQPFKGYPR